MDPGSLRAACFKRFGVFMTPGLACSMRMSGRRTSSMLMKQLFHIRSDLDLGVVGDPWLRPRPGWWRLGGFDFLVLDGVTETPPICGFQMMFAIITPALITECAERRISRLGPVHRFVVDSRYRWWTLGVRGRCSCSNWGDGLAGGLVVPCQRGIAAFASYRPRTRKGFKEEASVLIPFR